MMDISFSVRAYAKIILHAIKYPHCAINGVLLGKHDKSINEVQILDAVPLFHQCLNLAPMSEIALTTAEQLASNQGLLVAGYYLANENIYDFNIDKPAHKSIYDKIVENFNQAIIAVIDNQEMTMQMQKNPLMISQFLEGKWKWREKTSINYRGGTGLMESISYLIKNEKYRTLVDFDNHLDNITLDWKNTALNIEIEKAIGNHR